jgi:hypothetical protein
MKKLLLIILLLFTFSAYGQSYVSGDRNVLFTEEFSSGVIPDNWDTVFVEGSSASDSRWFASLLIWEGGTDYIMGVYGDFDEEINPIYGEKYLITPQVTIRSRDTLHIDWIEVYLVEVLNDTLYIMVSTTDNSVESFTQIGFIHTGALGDDTETSHSFSLDDYKGQDIYIAFRHVNIGGNGGYINKVEIKK